VGTENFKHNLHYFQALKLKNRVVDHFKSGKRMQMEMGEIPTYEA
jgi:hypothetical protein